MLDFTTEKHIHRLNQHVILLNEVISNLRTYLAPEVIKKAFEDAKKSVDYANKGNANQVLSDDVVNSIRKSTGKLADIAKEHNVNITTVTQIKRGIRYKTVAY